MRKFLVAALLFLALPASVAAQSFVIIEWDPVTMNLEGAPLNVPVAYQVLQDGVEVGTTSQTSWTAQLTDTIVHNYSVKAYTLDQATSTKTYSDESSKVVYQVCIAGQYRATYFPSKDFSGYAFAYDCPTSVAFNFGTSGPYGRTDNFSMKLQRVQRFTDASTLAVNGTSDDGVRVLVNGATIVDAWRDQSETAYNGSTHVPANTDINEEIQYYESTGNAVLRAAFLATADAQVTCGPDASGKQAVKLDVGDWTRNVSVNANGRVSYSLLNSRNPVTTLIVRFNGMERDRLTGSDLKKVAGSYFSVGSTRGMFSLTVEAQDAMGCSDGASRPMTVNVK